MLALMRVLLFHHPYVAVAPNRGLLSRDRLVFFEELGKRERRPSLRAQNSSPGSSIALKSASTKASSRCFGHPCEGDAGEQEDMDRRGLFWVRRC